MNLSLYLQKTFDKKF